jgi:hypothetical protein
MIQRGPDETAPLSTTNLQSHDMRFSEDMRGHEFCCLADLSCLSSVFLFLFEQREKQIHPKAFVLKV